MARRSSSRSSRTAAAAAPRVGADGKVDIFCPNCGTRFKLVEEALDAKVECSVCTNKFLPRNTVGKLARGKDHSMFYASMFVLALVIVGGLVLLMNKKGAAAEPSEATKVAPNPAAVLQIESDRRRGQLIKWAQKVAAGETFLIREYSDLDSICPVLGIDKRLAKDKLDAELLRALKANIHTRTLFEFDCNSAEMPPEAARADASTATLLLTPKAGDENYDRLALGKLAVDFRMDAGNVKITNFRVVEMPQRKRGR